MDSRRLAGENAAIHSTIHARKTMFSKESATSRNTIDVFQTIIHMSSNMDK